ncbi:hypothetical protein MRX96_028002 [Rhipicephalus microplus]
MDILAHALRELNSSRLPAFCAKFKVSFSAGSANDTGDDSRLDDSRRDPCVVIEHVMEEKVSHPFKDPLSAVGDCLFRSSARKKSDSRTNSLVLSTARRLCRRGLAAGPYAEGHLAAKASPLKEFSDKANFDKRLGVLGGNSTRAGFRQVLNGSGLSLARRLDFLKGNILWEPNVCVAERMCVFENESPRPSHAESLGLVRSRVRLEPYSTALPCCVPDTVPMKLIFSCLKNSVYKAEAIAGQEQR